MPGFSNLLRAVLALLLLATLLPAATARAQTVRNTASISFAGTDGKEVTRPSNTVEFTATRYKTRITYHRVPTDWNVDLLAAIGCDSSGAIPVLTAAAVPAAIMARAQRLESLDLDNPMLVMLDAPGENADPERIETTWVESKAATRSIHLLLTETGPNTGQFAAAYPKSDRNPTDTSCDIRHDMVDGMLTLYFEGDENDDGAWAQLLIDPLGIVFDSATGRPVDGATVTLIDDVTGQPAEVFGDDGVSSYPHTVTTGGRVTDSSGWDYVLQPGEFRFPYARPGRYRLQVVPPAGYSAPSKASMESMAGFKRPDSYPFELSVASYGGSFALATPEPVTIDIPIDPAPIRTEELRPALALDKQASVREAELGDFVQYQLTLRNSGSGAATDITVADNLPRGLRYRAGSTRGASEPHVSSDGRVLRFDLARLAVNASTQISYLVEIAPDAPRGELVNRAVATSAEARSNEATAVVRVRSPLFTNAFTIVGRVTEGACGDPERGRKGVAGIRLLMDDGTYVVTDKDGLYHFEGARPGTHVVQIDLASVPRSHAPVACDSDTRAAGSAISRFVEGDGGSLQRVDFQLRPTGLAVEKGDALPVMPKGDAEAAGNREDWLDLATPGIGWLFPDAGHNPRAPAVRAVVRHGPDQRVALTLNGQAVDVLRFDGTDADKSRGVAVSRWSSLALIEGDNRLQARVLNADGSVADTIERTVHYSNTPATAVYVADKSRLVADGLARPLIAVRVTDRAGKPVRAGTPVPFRVDQPYRAAQAAAAEQGRQLAGLERAQTVAQVVGDDGLAFLSLEPTRQPGMVHVTVTLADREREQAHEIKAWLATPAQDWVVVGFGKGTIGYDRLSGAERLAKGKRGDTVTDGQLTLYAKGRIKGSWLLTMAYDSDKDRELMRERGVLGTIDPDRYYTVYGDGTLQGQDAASRRKLYLRLERREFYALYGDFETGFVDTRLGRYSRTLNGVKAEYAGNRVQFSAFGAYDDSRYGRDEIQGNGLSGPYKLSGRDLVPGSDKIRLETRDRFRSEKIVDSRALTRNIDYDIDPLAGTIRFRDPILSRDADLNPVFIVADYEIYGAGKKRIAGARAVARIGKAEVGATVLRDESDGKGTVVAVDAKLRISRTTEVRAEAGMGGKQGLDEGQSWLAEVEHHGPKADVLVYARQQDRAFGLGQQNAGETGMRKFGFDGRVKLSDRWNLAGSAWHQQDLAGPAQRVAGDARLEYRRPTGTLYAGVRFASDTGVAGADRQSLLLTLGGTQKLMKNRLELNAETQLPLGGKDDSVDFPARQTFGSAWRFNDWLRVLGGFELAKGEKFTAQNTRLGFDVAPWGGARLLATMNRGAIGENGTRTYAQYGLSQSLPISKRWTIDATIDSASTLSGRIPAGDIVNPLHPVASGGTLGANGMEGDFVALTLGAAYTGTRWSWNGRAEYRNGSKEDRWGVTSNLLRALGEGKTLASGVRAFRVRQANGAVSSSINADVALALRPIDSRWSLLERFQLRSEHADSGTSVRNPLGVPVLAAGAQGTLRAINNLAVNYRTGNEGDGHGLEASVYYGAKYVRGRYADEKVDGFIDVLGIEIRKDLSERFDLGATAGARHSWSNGAVQWTAGISAGVSPAKNLWVTAGYNVTGYRDRDFEEARWTRQGPYLTMRMKFDQSSLGALFRPLTGDAK